MSVGSQPLDQALPVLSGLFPAPHVLFLRGTKGKCEEDLRSSRSRHRHLGVICVITASAALTNRWWGWTGFRVAVLEGEVYHV